MKDREPEPTSATLLSDIFGVLEEIRDELRRLNETVDGKLDNRSYS